MSMREMVSYMVVNIWQLTITVRVCRLFLRKSHTTRSEEDSRWESLFNGFSNSRVYLFLQNDTCNLPYHKYWRR